MKNKNRMGQGLVELALTIPIMLLLLLGIVEFGRAWMVKNLLTGASREAARAAVVQFSQEESTNIAIVRAQDILTLSGIEGASVTVINHDPPDMTLEVIVSYSFPISFGGFFGFIGMNDHIILSSSTSMRRQNY